MFFEQPLRYARKRKSYKYVTVADWTCFTGILDLPTHVLPWASLRADGTLYIREGYAWDGASGPAIDTKNWMRPSLVHDALYQLMREGEGPLTEQHRDKVDRLMYRMLLEEGMWRVRALYSYWAVRLFGGPRAKRRRLKEYRVPPT